MKTAKNLAIIRSIFALKFIFWVALALFYFTSQLSPNPDVSANIVFVLLLADALGYLGLAILLGWQSKIIFWLATFFVFANIILTITDEFGIWDFVTLASDILILFLLFNFNFKKSPK